MREWIRFAVAGFVACALFLGVVHGQITVPFPTFVAGTTIQPSEVNANFAKFADALNRTGGTMTGALTTQNLVASSHNTYDVGSNGTRYRDLWLSRNLVAGGTGQFSDTGASSLDVGGGINAGTGNVALVGTDGRIPAIDSTRFASLSGVNLTGLVETAITDGSVLARIGGNETISGTWGFTNATAFNNAGAAAIDVAGGIQAGSGNVGIVGTDGRVPALSATYFASLSGANLTGLHQLNASNTSAFSGNTILTQIFSNSSTGTTAGSELALGNSANSQRGRILLTGTGFTPSTPFVADGLHVYTTGDGGATIATSSTTNGFRVLTGGSLIEYFNVTPAGVMTALGAVAMSGTISPSALSANQNDYNPTGLSTATMVRLTTDGGGVRNLTGLAGGAAGRFLFLCNIGTVNAITFTGQDANSSAANRFLGSGTINIGVCQGMYYDGVASRWIQISG